MTAIVSTPHGLATESTAGNGSRRFLCRDYFQHVQMIRIARQEGAVGESAYPLPWYRPRDISGRFVGKVA